MADVAEFDAGEMARPDDRKDITSGADEISFQSGRELFFVFQWDDGRENLSLPDHFCFVKAERRFTTYSRQIRSQRYRRMESLSFGRRFHPPSPYFIVGMTKL
ncbi:hypothetical protein [Sphingobium sp. YR768]|uniref:hypothetical protein n=1 Tax=Sphingobium sp. YR768 TaxID=1884365 RepID=UPI00115FF009|nr:hypothetical protein [Sphingobium sp. YR768]